MLLKNLLWLDPLWDLGLPGDEEFAKIDHDMDLSIPDEDTVIASGPAHVTALREPTLVELFETPTELNG